MNRAIPLILLILVIFDCFIPMLDNMPADIPINGKYTEDPSQKEDMNVIPSNIFGRVRMYVKAAIRGKQGRKPVRYCIWLVMKLEVLLFIAFLISVIGYRLFNGIIGCSFMLALLMSCIDVGNSCSG